MNCEYRVEEQLESGAFSTVYRCTHKYTNQPVAIKQIIKSKYGKQEAATLKSLAEIEGIPRLLTTVSDSSYHYLIMEYAAGVPLYNYMEEHMDHLDMAKIKKYVKRLLEILCVVHSRGIAHSDVKPENIIINTQNDNVMLVDWGLSHSLEYGLPSGSLLYASPELVSEIVEDDKHYIGPLNDVWAIGIIIYIATTTVLPYNDEDNYTLKREIANIDIQWRRLEKHPLAYDLLKKILTPMKNRITACEAMKHPWFCS
jgi:serine/threonine protein kinase